MALDTAYWTVFNHVTIWGSLVVYFALQFIYNYLFNAAYVGSLAVVSIELVLHITTINPSDRLQEIITY